MVEMDSALPTIIVKIFKLILNLIIIILYRVGNTNNPNGTNFLGIGGTWNLNEDRTPDPEIVASGVFVGYFIYTVVQIAAMCFARNDEKYSFTDIIMNLVGIFMWMSVGGTALHYWTKYQSEVQYVSYASEKQFGLAVGSLCIIQGALFFLDTAVTVLYFVRNARRRSAGYDD